MQLLLGIYPVVDGNIFIENIKIDACKKSSLHEKVSILLREPFLFNTSIIENVLYGNPTCSIEDGI